MTILEAAPPPAEFRWMLRALGLRSFALKTKAWVVQSAAHATRDRASEAAQQPTDSAVFAVLGLLSFGKTLDERLFPRTVPLATAPMPPLATWSRQLWR